MEHRQFSIYVVPHQGQVCLTLTNASVFDLSGLDQFPLPDYGGHHRPAPMNSGSSTIVPL